MISRKEKHSKKPPRAGEGAVGEKRRWWKSKQFKWTLAIIGLVLAVIIGIYAYSISHFVTKIQEPIDGDMPVKVEEWTGTEPVNIVLLGVDNRDNDKNPRSDSILVVSVDPETKKAHVMSVMRDTWYKIPGYGYEKINAAHALGGPDLTIQTLKDLLQIKIHYYVKTDFQGFIKIVDALGGVDIDVEKDLNYADDGVYDIHLKKGLQHLSGQQALMYVRFRHDAMSDFARTERQRKFLAAVSDEMKSPVALAKLPSILSDIEPYIKTNMTAADMIKLGKLALSVDNSDLQSLQVPPMDALKEGYAGGGQAVLIPNVYQTRKEVYDFLGLDASKLTENAEDQPQEYYQPAPVVPQNPKVEPDTPEQKVDPEKDGQDDGKIDPFKPDAGGTTDPNAGGGTTTPGGGTTTPGGGTTTPGGGTTAPGGGTTTPGGGTTTPGGGTTTPGSGTTTPGGGTTTPGGGTTAPGGSTTTPGGGTAPGTGGGTTPGTETGTTPGTSGGTTSGTVVDIKPGTGGSN
jgi:polyisoprenyl-teichoic acid--peptidoglycan teichoic acid transferase